MTTSLMPNAKQQYFTANGVPLSGGLLYTYEAGTTTPKVTYSDAAGTTPNANPIVLDSRGEATVFWDGSYKVVLKDSLGTTIWTQDNVVVESLALRADLASTASGKGANLVGIDDAVTYDPDTVGSWLRVILNKGVSLDFEGSGSDAGLIKPFIWYNPAPTATDVADFGILRRSATGGTAGVTNSAFRVIHVAQAGTASFEWASLSIMENNATAGENVAGYWQGKKNSTGPTWAGVLEAIDTTGTANPTTGLVGAEVDIRANGTDNNNNRVGVDVVVTRQLVSGSPTGTAMQAGFGVRVQTSGDASATVKTGFGFANTTKVVTAFDCSTAEVSGDAVKIASGQTVSFDENSQHRMRYQSTVGLTYGAGGVDQSSLRQDGTIWSRPLTFATLPTAGVFGRKAVISDCTTTTFNAVAAGGGANKVPVFDDGAAWRVG